MAAGGLSGMTFVPGPIEPVEIPERAVSFEAVVHVVGVNPVVEIPSEKDAFTDRGYIPVVARVGTVFVRATLVPSAAGRRLYLNGPMRVAGRIEAGDLVQVVVWRDPDPREVTAPADVQASFEEAGVWSDFLALPASQRRELVVTVEAARTVETRAKRIRRAVDHVRQWIERG